MMSQKQKAADGSSGKCGAFGVSVLRSRTNGLVEVWKSDSRAMLWVKEIPLLSSHHCYSAKRSKGPQSNNDDGLTDRFSNNVDANEKKSEPPVGGSGDGTGGGPWKHYFLDFKKRCLRRAFCFVRRSLQTKSLLKKVALISVLFFTLGWPLFQRSPETNLEFMISSRAVNEIKARYAAKAELS